MALTDKLTNIANAIREKGGTTEKLTLAQMPNAIAALSTGGGELEIPVLTGDASYYDYAGAWDWFINANGNKITTNKIEDMGQAFRNCNLETIPFEINCKTDSPINWMSAFYNARQLKEIGKINCLYPSYGMNIFGYCIRLRNLPEIGTFKFDTDTWNRNIGWFYCCYSLRSVPEDMLKKIYSTKLNYNFCPLYEMFYKCYVIDEIVGINPQSKAFTDNAFYHTFDNCYRVKNIIFATQEDGTPYTAQWKNQTIDLSQYVGWAGAAYADKDITTNYNSGITAEDEDNDWSNNPNYWSRQFMNSRFNHNSAVNLINSLPDTSAYLAANGGTNTVKFYTNAGSGTPGGGVNALTEEEIAVATAKGWTITYGV